MKLVSAVALARLFKLFETQVKLLETQVIHLDDIFLSGDDVFGAGVNLAACLQNQANPGGICISDTVYEVIKNHLSVHVTYIGAQQLKGIPEPVRLYQINP